MLTNQKLTETALEIINDELAKLAEYDRSEQIDKALCKDCLPMDCARDPEEYGVEIRAVHQEIKEAAAFLRDSLGEYAKARGITIPSTDA